MRIVDIFQDKATHLYWQRLEDGHVEEGHPARLIEDDQYYFVVRMKEMYLKYSRKLWRKFYPMLHGFVEYRKQEEHSVAGPGQLRELGEANLDRVINLNYRLAGPTPYKDGDVTLLAGLYAVPGQDAAKALLTTVGTIAGLGGVALGQVPAIADAVKAGVESIIGLDEASLQLGVRDTFYQNNPLRAGYHVAINASAREVDANSLWLWKGRLIKGVDPIAGVPYEDHDYMVLEVEARDTRDDWPALPEIADYQKRFSALMADEGLSVEKKRERLRDLWPQFQNAVKSSPNLVRPDRERIALSVAEDLKARLKAMEEDNPFFETRSWGTEAVQRRSPAEFDLADVPDYLDPSDRESLRRAGAALEGDPF